MRMAMLLDALPLNFLETMFPTLKTARVVVFYPIYIVNVFGFKVRIALFLFMYLPKVCVSSIRRVSTSFWLTVVLVARRNKW